MLLADAEQVSRDYSSASPPNLRAAGLRPTPVTTARWPLPCMLGTPGAGSESALSRLQLVRSRLAPGAAGWLDAGLTPDSGPGAEMRVCGE